MVLKDGDTVEINDPRHPEIKKLILTKVIGTSHTGWINDPGSAANNFTIYLDPKAGYVATTREDLPADDLAAMLGLPPATNVDPAILKYREFEAARKKRRRR